MVAPHALPFQHEPGRKTNCVLTDCGHLGLQRVRTPPPPPRNLVAVRVDATCAAAYEDRAQLVLGPDAIELSLIMELVDELQWTAHPELLIQAPMNRTLHRLGAAGVAAAAVRPVQRPQPL